jgi:dihydrofolate reductase
MKITLIAALAKNRVIGINNTLPWKLSADLKRFKALTTGHTILMGRKTFESLGRPLPQRRHVCVSRQYPSTHLTPDARWPEQVFWCGDLHAALALLEKENAHAAEAGVFIIGGQDIYTQALASADTLELTHLDAPFEGDAWFPCFSSLFKKESEEAHTEGEMNFRFASYASLRPEGIRVRTATAKELDFLVHAQIKMALETENLNLETVKVKNGAEAILNGTKQGRYLIAERKDATHASYQPVGCLLLQSEWSDWRNAEFFWVHSFFVEATERRNGIGRWLLRVAEELARTAGAAGLRLYVDKRNSTAAELYRSFSMNSSHYDLFEKEFARSN